MNEINPYRSPETAGAARPPQREPRIRYYASGGLLIGISLGAIYSALSLLVEPPILFSDLVEVLTKGLGIGVSVGLLVGLLWGLFRVMRAAYNR